MKRFLFATLLLVMVLPQAISAQEKKYEVYGVGFYNLENLFDTIPNNPLGRDEEFTPHGSRQWNGDKYWKKIHNMAFAISKMTSKVSSKLPVIIGVSEIENRSVLEDLVRDPQIKKERYQIVHHDSPDRRGVDVGLLYNPRVFQVLSVVNSHVDIPFATRDQMCVTGLLAGEKVSVIVNHWPSRLGGEKQSSKYREKAAERVKMTVDSLLREDPNQGIIIMGDMNDDPHNASCAKVLNAKKNRSEVQPGGLYNPFWETLDKGIGTLAYRGSWNLFDQIIINNYFLGEDRSRLSYLRNEVHNKPEITNQEGQYKNTPKRTYSGGVFLNGFSDHYPTEIFLVRESK